jgi:hypothetical protein
MKQYLTNIQAKEWIFYFLNREIIIYRDFAQFPDFKGDLEVWKVESTIFIFILPIAFINLLITYLFMKLQDKK